MIVWDISQASSDRSLILNKLSLAEDEKCTEIEIDSKTDPRSVWFEDGAFKGRSGSWNDTVRVV